MIRTCYICFLSIFLSSFLLPTRVNLAGAEFFCWALGHDFLLAWICFLFLSWCYSIYVNPHGDRSAYGYIHHHFAARNIRRSDAKLQFLKAQFAPCKRVVFLWHLKQSTWICSRWFFTFYHSKLPLNHHSGCNLWNFFQASNTQI